MKRIFLFSILTIMSFCANAIIVNKITIRITQSVKERGILQLYQNGKDANQTNKLLLEKKIAYKFKDTTLTLNGSFDINDKFNITYSWDPCSKCNYQAPYDTIHISLKVNGKLYWNYKTGPSYERTYISMLTNKNFESQILPKSSLSDSQFKISIEANKNLNVDGNLKVVYNEINDGILTGRQEIIYDKPFTATNGHFEITLDKNLKFVNISIQVEFNNYIEGLNVLKIFLEDSTGYYKKVLSEKAIAQSNVTNLSNDLYYRYDCPIPPSQ